MKDRDTPLRIVRQVGKLIPGGYDEIERLKADNIPVVPGLPKFRDVPIEINFEHIFLLRGFAAQLADDMSLLATACYLWRENKIIYSFDEDLSSALAEQANDFKDTDILPANILMHPPYPCTFVKTGVIAPYSGFWYWVENDGNVGRTVLHVQFIIDNMRLVTPTGLHLLPGKTIRECWDDTITGSGMHTSRHSHSTYDLLKCGEQILHDVLVVLQFILYISSEDADIQDVPSKTVTKVRQKRNRTLDKASEVKEKAVGVRIGNAIRKGRSFARSSSRDTPSFTVRPHSRRGHWHHYWVGPKDGDRTLILKWTAPTFIHQDAFQNDTVVVFPVKQ